MIGLLAKEGMVKQQLILPYDGGASYHYRQ